MEFNVEFLSCKPTAWKPAGTTFFSYSSDVLHGVCVRRILSYPVPACSSLGLGMFGSIEAGREASITFWEEHVGEVSFVWQLEYAN